MLEFIQMHQAAFSALGIAILDFAIHVAPGIQANGIVHLLLVWAGISAPAV